MILGNNFMDSNEFKCRTQVDLYGKSRFSANSERVTWSPRTL